MNDNVHSDPEAKAEVAFAKLRPVCVEVMRAPSLEALRALHEAVGRLDCIHPHLVEYIVLPLRMIIRRSGSSNLRLLEATLDAFTAVFCRVKELSLESWEVFEELFGFMCLLLDTKMAAQAGYASCSEDLLLSVVRAMRALLLSLADSALARLHTRLPLLGHGVSVLLDVVTSQPAKALRAGAVGALLALSGRDDEEIARLAHSDDHCITAADPAHCLRALPGCVGVGRCGGAFASFLPGIAMALCKLVTMDTKVGQTVLSIALLAWAHFVSMVMADREATGLEDVPSGTHVHNPSTSSTNEQSLGEGKSLMVERTPTWQAETDSKLSILVQKMTSLVTRDGWRVRFTVVLWAHCLLTHCHRTLVTCMPAVLEVLVTLTHDDYQQVSSAARQAMELFSHEYAKEDSRQLTSMLEERLHALVSSLPRLMRQHDDARKVLTLQLLDGYLRLLGPHVISLVHSYPHLSRITQALLQTLTLEVGDTRIIEQPKMEAEEGKSGTGEGWRLPLKYRHFRSERIETLLHHACQLLGFYGSLPVLLDHLLDLFRGSTHYRKEVTIVIENVLVGAAGWGCVKGMGEPPHGVPPEQLYSLCEGVMEEMVTPEVWRGEERRNSGSTHPQEPTLLSCLLLVTITTVVKVMGQAFDRLLQLMIYPLMQQLGHSSAAVSSHALGTLRTVCSNCGYSSLEQLITHNADYLVNHVSLQLRTGPTRHPEALLVLQAMFRYGEEAVLPLMRDSVEELFLSLDLREDPALLWPALHTLALATARWTAGSVTATVSPDAPPTTVPEKKVGRPHPPEERLRPSPREIQDFFLEYHKCKERERLTGIEEDDEQQNAGAAEQEEDSAKPRPIPAHQLAMEVLQRCAHYLASPAPTLRLTVLDTLGHCLLSLRANETALLPEVHKVWPAFLHRLSDSTPSVAVRAWGVLLVMVEVCREFLRRRVVKEVWPHLIGQLESLATKSTNPDKLYRQTANFKLQRKLLECVGILCEHLDIRSSDEEQLAHACVPYLSTEQPDELRKTCQTSLIPLVRRDPDRMWLLLQQLQPQEVTVPPHRSLKPYKFAAFPSSSKFTDDATVLLELTM